MGYHCTNSILSVLPLLFILQVFLPVYSQRSDCQTPRRSAGNCIELNQCNELLQLIESHRPESYDYLRQSQCGFRDDNPKVCCPIKANGTLLPQDCGRDLSQRIVGGEKADIYEFPWMALLEYNRPSGKVTACGGVLISKRYVMTAAHCVKGKDLPRSWSLVSVRLGEYDTSTEQDCIPEGDGTLFCADAPLSVNIEQQIVHEEYNPQSRDQLNDIALLRLNRNVGFTNFVRPICLPPSNALNDSFYHVAGWGKTESAKPGSAVKLKLRIPAANQTQCANTYHSVSIRLGHGQICAGGDAGRDTCRGDSGGPLMTVKMASDQTLQWTVAGVVSFGPSPCGAADWPGVYTKVTDFVPWLLSKMRA